MWGCALGGGADLHTLYAWGYGNHVSSCVRARGGEEGRKRGKIKGGRPHPHIHLPHKPRPLHPTRTTPIPFSQNQATPMHPSSLPLSQATPTLFRRPLFAEGWPGVAPSGEEWPPARQSDSACPRETPGLRPRPFPADVPEG